MGRGARRFVIAAVMVPAMVAGVLCAVAGASGSTQYVSPTASSSNADASCSSAAYSEVQTALEAVAPGGVVHVCAGNYATQVTITTSDVTVEGTGQSSVIEPRSVTCEEVATSGLRPTSSTGDWAPIVDVTPRVSAITISELDIDGAGASAYVGTSLTRCGLVGVLFDHAGGSVTDAFVEDVTGEHSTVHDTVRNVGIDVAGGIVSVNGTTVSGYDSNGIACNGAGASCAISGNTIKGSGAIPVPQTGIQLSGGATGSVSRNTVEDNELATNTTEGIGILLFDLSGVPVTTNTLVDDQAAIVAGSFGKTPGSAMKTDRVTSNTISYDSAYRGSGTVTAGIYVFADAPRSMTARVQGNSISGPGANATSVAGLEVGTIHSYGVYRTDFGYGSVSVTATDNTMSGWHDDVVGAGEAFTAHLQHNELLGGSTAAGVENSSRTKTGSTAVTTLDATENWWGCSNGPGATGCTTVSGSVDYRPWLTAASTSGSTAPTGSYRVVSAGGDVYDFDAPSDGSTGDQHLNQPIVGVAADPATGGYWLVAADGGVFAFGSAAYEGSVPGDGIEVSNIVGLASAG